MRCQICGAEVDAEVRVCKFCGSSLPRREDRSRTQRVPQEEPRSEIRLGDVAKTIADSAKVVKDILSPGSELNVLGDMGKVIDDLHEVKGSLDADREGGQKVPHRTRRSEEVPYYMKPGEVEEPRDEHPELVVLHPHEFQPTPESMKEVPHESEKDVTRPQAPHPLEEPLLPPVQVGGPEGVKVGWEYPHIRKFVEDDPSLGQIMGKPQAGALDQPLIRPADIPLFIHSNSLSQMVMSAFEVLPKETFGLLFGTVSPRKVFVSSVQPSQAVVSREESYVQPSRGAIDRLEALKSRLSSTDLVGSYHSHVYLSGGDVGSIEEGSSPSAKDAENLSSSPWRQVLVIIGYFSAEAWGLPMQETGWRREGRTISCNKLVEALGHRGFHIRVSAYVKREGHVYQVPIYLGSGEVNKEGRHAICPICGGEVVGGICRHCGSRGE